MYSYYRSITIDHTKCGSANSTDFPVLIYGTYTYLKTTGNGGNVTSSSGYDIAFYSDSGLTTQLKHETVSWNGSTGAVEYWVKVPTLSSSSDTVIYIAYGDSGVTTDQSDPTNTWSSSFVAVYHMGNDPSGSAPQLIDSTGNSIDMTSSGSMTSGDVVAGGVTTSAIDFDGTDDLFYSSDHAALDVTNVTLSAWVNMSNKAGVRSFIMRTYNNNWNASPYASYVIRHNSNINRIEFWAGAYAEQCSTTTIPNVDTWYLIHGTFDGSNWKIYMNGALEDTYASSTAIAATSQPLIIGSHASPSGSPGEYMMGKLDEMRVINVSVSADWITSEYNNQSSPSTFYTIGSEVSNGSSVARIRSFMQQLGMGR